MQVFRLCLKILKKQIPSMLIYIIIFLAIALIMSSATANEQQQDNSFTRAKSNMALISEENTPLIDGFKQELGKVANFVELPDDHEALQDALYFRSVSYILRVPEGFTESFMQGENVQLEKTIVPNSISNTYIDLCIDQYFNTARLYVQQMENISQESLVQYLKSDLAVGASVELKTVSDQSVNHNYANYYFNYLSYSLLSVLILGMAALMLVFYDSELKRRNACSPLSSKSVNLQFILAILVFTVLSCLIMVTFCILFNFKNSLNLNTVYFIINSFVFAVCGAGISFLIGNLVKSHNAIPAISNVVTLGLCFISGVFVPLELLGNTAIKIASFTPTYWFVKANNQIAELTQFGFADVEPIFSSMLIQIGFALAFFAAALVVNKKRRFD
ncbi:MAG: ABC transporter permease [Syntrophaceticus sp.]|jgi:ABC-2 type transport system permease protein|nr:ABC transporter permease [Syntrophaceticus sp.]MDD3314795.1 ABC transporter permease [Syntrophaceticus sp.]